MEIIGFVVLAVAIGIIIYLFLESVGFKEDEYDFIDFITDIDSDDFFDVDDVTHTFTHS